MSEENKRESFPQEAQDPQPIETQAVAPAEVSETAAPGVEAAPAEVGETTAPGVGTVPQQGAPHRAEGSQFGQSAGKLFAGPVLQKFDKQIGAK